MKKTYIFLGLLLAASNLFAESLPLRVTFRKNPFTLNPVYAITSVESQIFTGIHEGLFYNHPETLQPVPALAESWEVNEDQTVYTFTIRKNARFSNGDKITAETVRHNWIARLDAGEENSFGSLFDVIQSAEEYRLNDSTTPPDIRAINARTLEVHLEHPTPYFLKMLSHHTFSVIHPSLFTERDWFALPSGRIPVSGPFQITEHSEDQIILEKNPRYWNRSEVSIPKITLIFHNDPPEVISDRFNKGEIDWDFSGAFSYAELLFPDRAVVVTRMFSVTTLFFHADQPPFDRPEIRTALIMLLPEELLRPRQVFQFPTRTFVPPIRDYPSPEGIEFNRAAGMTLLRKAGYGPDTPLPPISLRLPPSFENLESAAYKELFTSAWSSVTEELTIDFSSTNAFTEEESGYLIDYFGWIGDYTDPVAFLELWRSGSKLNLANYHSEKYDQMLRASMEIRDRKERYAALAEAEEFLLNAGVVIPLENQLNIQLIDLQRFSGWYANPLDIHPFGVLEVRPSSSLPDAVDLELKPRIIGTR